MATVRERRHTAGSRRQAGAADIIEAMDIGRLDAAGSECLNAMRHIEGFTRLAQSV